MFKKLAAGNLNYQRLSTKSPELSKFFPQSSFASGRKQNNDFKKLFFRFKFVANFDI